MLRTPPTITPHPLATAGQAVLLCGSVGAVAMVVGDAIPLIGHALAAVVIGIVIALVRRPGVRVGAAVATCGKWSLQVAVVLLGAQMSMSSIAKVGAATFPVMICSLAVCLIGAHVLSRLLHVDGKLATLIGVGTGVCGASAIAAVSPVIAASAAQIGYAISTIFLFNVLAVVLFPLLGHALNLDPHAFGLLAGTAVNDTSSVVATAGAFGSAALGFAVVVKLVRTLSIIPISIGLSVREARRNGGGDTLTPAGVIRLVPPFLVGFLIVALINSAGVIPPWLQHGLGSTSAFLIAAALGAIGMATDIPALRRAGWRPLAMGAILWALVTATTIAMMLATGNYTTLSR